MERTTIMLPSELRSRALRRARRLGVSLAQFVRMSLNGELEREGPIPGKKDSLFDDDEVYEGPYPAEPLKSIDDELYGEHP
jgi:hypothetical protein